MEATGVYYESLAYFLRDEKKTVHVVLPNYAKKYGQSLGVESKTDKIDARTLAQMGLERKLKEWQPFSSNFLTLKQLTRGAGYIDPRAYFCFESAARLRTSG
jgi:transposase